MYDVCVVCVVLGAPLYFSALQGAFGLAAIMLGIALRFIGHATCSIRCHGLLYHRGMCAHSLTDCQLESDLGETRDAYSVRL